MRVIVATCLTIVLLTAYGIAYTKALKKDQHFWFTNPRTGRTSAKYPEFSFGGVAFLPAHLVDRMLRYRFWTEGPPRPNPEPRYLPTGEPENP